MKTIATICARGGSKGVPGKNIRMLAGKPLIAHTIDQAKSCSAFSGIYVSTDDPEIARVAEMSGAIVPGLRPAELATDAAAKVPVIRHLVDTVMETGVDVEAVADLDATSPLRTVGDIEACLALLTTDIDVVITACEAEKNPYFNMVEAQPDGGWNLVKSNGQGVVSRQSAPAVYAMNASIYVWWEKTIEKGLFGARTALYEMPRERSIDIDTEMDFEMVEYFMKRN